MKKIITVLTGLILSCSVLALPRSDNPGTEVKDSKIQNVNQNVRIDARNRSSVNTGIQARGAKISNSSISNKFTGNVSAVNSTVSTGVKADSAIIKNSEISTESDANISARNSTVKTGVDISGASHAEIKTKYKGNINASGAVVKAGSVEGDIRHKKITTDVQEDINARGRGMQIGTVKSGGGKPSSYKVKSGFDYSKQRGNAGGARIGNVNVQGATTREVKTSVGTGNLIEGLKTRHMANVYKKTGGVDPSGTKHVYVNKKQKERAKKTGGSMGNTTTRTGIRKVNTYVE